MQTLNSEQKIFLKEAFKEVKLKNKPLLNGLDKTEQSTNSNASGFNKRYLHTFSDNLYTVQGEGKNHTHIFESQALKKNEKNCIFSQDLGKFGSSFLGTERMYVEGVYNYETKIFTTKKDEKVLLFNAADNTLFIGTDNFDAKKTFTGISIAVEGGRLSGAGQAATLEDNKITVHESSLPPKHTLLDKIKNFFSKLFTLTPKTSVKDLLHDVQNKIVEVRYDREFKHKIYPVNSKSSDLLASALDAADKSNSRTVGSMLAGEHSSRISNSNSNYNDAGHIITKNFREQVELMKLQHIAANNSRTA